MEMGQNHVSQFANDPKVRWGVVAVLFLLAAFLLVITISSLKEFRYIGGGVPVTNTITVQGEGEVFAVPDTATFTFSVVEERETVELAQEVATNKMNDIVKFLEDGGIDEKDVRTIGYNVYPKYEWQRGGATALPAGGYAGAYYPPDGKQVIVGYEVSQTVQVKVRDTESAGKLISGVGSMGASNISGLAFTIDDEDALQAEARRKAIDDARAKARQLAADLDVRLIRVVSFGENGYYPYANRTYLAEGLGGATDAAIPAMEKAVLPLGENRIVSNVSVTYEIR